MDDVAKSPAFERSPRYEAPALEWLHAEAVRLKDVLTAAGISALGVQREIVESFIFGLAYGLDHDEVDVEGVAHRPALCFDVNDVFLLPDPLTFSFHEYAIGCAAEPFETSD